MLAALAAGLALLLLTLAPWFWRRHLADQEAILARDAVIRAEHLRKQAEHYVQGIQSAARLIQLGDAKQAHALLQTLGDSGDDHPRGFEWHRLERLVRGQPLMLGDHQGDVYAAVYSPDGATLATCGKDGTVRLRDAASGKTRQVIGPVGTELNGLSFSPDGSRLAACGDDSVIRVWELASISNPVLTIDAHEKQEAVGVLYTPDGRWLLSYGRDHMIRRLGRRDGEVERRLGWGCRRDRVRGHREAGANSSFAGRVLVGRRPRLVEGCKAQASEEEGFPWVFRTFRRGPLRRWPAGGRAVGREGGDLVGSRIPAPASAASGPSRVGPRPGLFSRSAESGNSGRGRELRLWSLEDGTSIGRLTGHVERAWGMTYSPDGRRLVTTGREGTVRLWDLDAWTERTVLPGPPRFAAGSHSPPMTRH